jgi:hypothetical protein
MKAIPEGDFRSTVMEALCRVSRSEVGAGFGEGEARSMRRTEAPLSARRRPAKGPVSLNHQLVQWTGSRGRYLELGQQIRGLGGLSREVEKSLL